MGGLFIGLRPRIFISSIRIIILLKKGIMITILSSFSGTYLSATLPDISFNINGYRARVEIKADDDVLFDDYLFPYASNISFSDLSELVQPYVERRLTASLAITITEEFTDNTATNTATLNADVVYCAADFNISNAESFLEEHYLSLYDGDRVTAMGRLEYLHYIGGDTPTATAEYSDGSTMSFSVEIVSSHGNFKTVDASPKNFMTDGKTLTAYTIEAGARAQRFVIDFNNPDCAPILLFANSFGCDELVYCTGTHTVSPEFNRETAYINKIKKNYKIEENREFKADTGVLTFPMANWLDDLFRSKNVRIVNFYDSEPVVGKEVVITESKSEYTNDIDSLPRFTFTYTYAQRNHNVVDLRRGGRIFDNTFDFTFN